MPNEERIIAIQVANFFLEKSFKENRALTVLKLVKLTYFAYGWIAAVLDRQLFDEPVQAWKYGPVVPSVYFEFKRWGNLPIMAYGTKLDISDEVDEAAGDNPGEAQSGIVRMEYPPEIEDEDVREGLDWVWKMYSPYTGVSLSQLTHAKNTPWGDTYKPWSRTKNPTEQNKISYEKIRGHFKKLLEEIEQEQGEAPS